MAILKSLYHTFLSFDFSLNITVKLQFYKFFTVYEENTPKAYAWW